MPHDRRQDIQTVRQVVLKNLPKGYRETFNWGMIAYEVPLEKLPHTYNGKPLMYAALASQKDYMALHLVTLYWDKKIEKWFREEFKASGKKLDMGKGCVRFKKLEALPLDVIGKTVARVPMEKYIAYYEKSHKSA